MATHYGRGPDISLLAGADLSASQYRIGDINGSRQAVVAGDGAGKGIIQNDPVAGEECALRVTGTSLVRLGATLAPGADFASDATGSAVAPTVGEQILGWIIDGGVVGDIVGCVLERNGTV